MKFIASKRSGRVTNFALAALLVVSTLTASVPFIFSQAANAVENYTSQSTGIGDWSADRTFPSGGADTIAFGGRSNVLNINIDTANASTDPGFYRTEGLKKDVAANDSIRADLYVDSSWSTKDVRAGLWGTGQDAGSVTAYPIVEFVTAGITGSYTGWRIYNTVDGSWTQLPDVAFNNDGWNTLETTLDATSGIFVYKINGVAVGTADSNGSSSIQTITLNSFNDGSNNVAENYAANWSNVQTGINDQNYSNVYVSTTGSDLNDGTTATAPFATIQKALDKVSVNGTVHVASGSYTASDLNVHTQGTKLIGDAGAKLVIPAVAEGVQVNAVDIHANNVTVSGFEAYSEQILDSYKVHTWTGTIQRGVAVPINVTGFTISGNNIHNVRNGILVDGQGNTGSITGNTIENTKGAISVQYTDGTGIAISGNQQGPIGNAWAVNLHLNGHFDAGVYSNAKIATIAPAPAQTVIRNLSTANGGWSVQDQGYATSNRSEVNINANGSATAQGDPLGNIDTFAHGIDAVIDGGLVKVTGPYTLTTNLNVTKPVVIDGQGNTITTSGGSQIFTFLASGSTFKNFTVQKDDNADQNIIGIQGNNTTITGNGFFAHFSVPANAGTTRALVVSTSTGTTISGNDFEHIRQPAYINDNATGVISANNVFDTKGFVLVANSNFSVTGNSFTANFADVAIIDNDGNPATPVVNNYTCPVTLAMIANNGNANVDNQVLTTPCPVQAPTSPRWLSHTGVILGAYTNVNLVTPAWNAPLSGADHYEYSYTSPTDSNWSAPAAFSGTSIPDQSFYGAGNNGTEGAWRFRVRTVDVTGDTSAWVESPVLTYDKTAPTVSTLVAPAPISNVVLNTGTFLLDWTDATDGAGSGVAYYEYQAANNGAVDSDGTLLAQNIVYETNKPGNQGPLPTSQVQASGTPDGTYYWQVRAIDNAGNASAWSEVGKVTVDTVKPAAPTVTATGITTGTTTNQGSVNILWTTPSTDTTKYDYRVWTNIAGDPYNGVANAYYDNGLTGNSRNGAFTQGDGTYFVQVRAIDAAGNISDWSNTFTVTYDHIAPAAPVLKVKVGSTDLVSGQSTNSYDFTQYWNTPTGSPVKYEYKYWNNISTSAYNDESHPYDVFNNGTSQPGEFNQGEGTHYIQVRAIDAAGNASDWSNTFTLVYDATAPGVSISAVITNPTDISGTVTEAATVKVTIDGTTYTTSSVGGNWSIPTPVLATGTYTVSVVATDPASNTTSPAVTAQLPIDKTGPAVAVDTSTDTTNQPTITGTVDADADHVNIVVEDANGVVVESGAATYITGGTTWSYATQTALPNGNYTVFARAYDAFSNFTDNSAVVTVAVAPAIAPATAPTTTATVTSSTTPIITNPAAAAVLGATTENAASTDAAVKGASDDKAAAAVSSEAGKGQIFGIAWFWWILILAVIAGIAWFIAAAVRRRNEANS
jgi:hypothetical protein